LRSAPIVEEKATCNPAGASLSECVSSERTGLLAELTPEPWTAASVATLPTAQTQRQMTSVSL
jgi:hypothetical protein